jgi:predicted nucleotidyltransferase
VELELEGGCRDVLERVRAAAEGLLAGRRGAYIVVFGSMAEGRCGPLSDVDVAVKGLSIEEASDLANALEKATGRRVNVVLIEHASTPLRYEALWHGVFIAGDRGSYVEDRWLALLEWLDFKETYEALHESYARRILGRRDRRN